MPPSSPATWITGYSGKATRPPRLTWRPGGDIALRRGATAAGCSFTAPVRSATALASTVSCKAIELRLVVSRSSEPKLSPCLFFFVSSSVPAGSATALLLPSSHLAKERDEADVAGSAPGRERTAAGERRAGMARRARWWSVINCSCAGPCRPCPGARTIGRSSAARSSSIESSRPECGERGRGSWRSSKTHD